MPELPTRQRHEDEIASALVLLFSEWDGRLVWDRIAFAGNVESVLEPRLVQIHKEASANFAADLGIDLADEEIARNAERWAASYTRPLASEIAQNTTPGEVGAFSPNRADMIATTETTRTITAAETALAAVVVTMAVDDGGREMRSVWYTSLDERVCPICRPLHGTELEVYGRVSANGPPAHPRCRCSLEWRLT